MSEITETLRRLGFAEYEARAYVTLLGRGPISGYELAKCSGVPRADIYGVLQKLEERGAVMRLDLEAGTRYAGVPAEEVILQLQARLEQNLAAARRSLHEIRTPPMPELVLNARGYPAFIEHSRALIRAARRTIFVAQSLPEAQALGEEFAGAHQRGLEVSTLCLDACAKECGYCQGRILREPLDAPRAARWFALTGDQEEMLAAEITETQTTSVRTRQPVLVGLARRYVLHNVALAMMVEDLGARIDEALRPETLSVLSEIDGGLEWWLRGQHRKEDEDIQRR